MEIVFNGCALPGRGEPSDHDDAVLHQAQPGQEGHQGHQHQDPPQDGGNCTKDEYLFNLKIELRTPIIFLLILLRMEERTIREHVKKSKGVGGGSRHPAAKKCMFFTQNKKKGTFLKIFS